jgi:hypothetical protein
MSLGAIVAGAPFFLAEGEGNGVALCVSSVPGDAFGFAEGAGDFSGVGVGDGDDLRFFFGEGPGEEPGAGVGEDFFFFFGEAEALGSALSVGVWLAEDFFFLEEEGDGDFSGVADGFGVGDFSASSFFFGVAELLRCLRGAGVGVGAKICLILLPNDSSARDRSALHASIPIKERAPAILPIRRMERESSTSVGDEYRALKSYVSSRAAETARDLTPKFAASA